MIRNVKSLIKSLFQRDEFEGNINEKMNQIYKLEYQRDMDFRLEAPATMVWNKTFKHIVTSKQAIRYLSNYNKYVSETITRKFYYYFDSGIPNEIVPLDRSKTYDVAVGSFPTYTVIGYYTSGALVINISENTVIPNGHLLVKDPDLNVYRYLYCTENFDLTISFPVLELSSAMPSVWFDDTYSGERVTTDIIGDFSVVPLLPVIISASESLPSAGIKTALYTPLFITIPLFKSTYTPL